MTVCGIWIIFNNLIVLMIILRTCTFVIYCFSQILHSTFFSTGLFDFLCIKKQSFLKAYLHMAIIITLFVVVD